MERKEFKLEDIQPEASEAEQERVNGFVNAALTPVWEALQELDTNLLKENDNWLYTRVLGLALITLARAFSQCKMVTIGWNGEEKDSDGNLVSFNHSNSGYFRPLDTKDDLLIAFLAYVELGALTATEAAGFHQQIFMPKWIELSLGQVSSAANDIINKAQGK